MENIPAGVRSYSRSSLCPRDDAARHGGEFSTANKLRLVHDLESAQLAEPDAIVVTCSSLSPYLPALRPFFRTPILSIDDAMCRCALDMGSRVAVLATAASALSPALWKLRTMAQERGMELDVQSFCNPDAIAALKVGDKETHERLLLELAAKVSKDVDSIVLAQASMADMREQVERRTGICTLASPGLCYEEIRDFLDGVKG